MASARIATRRTNNSGVTIIEIKGKFSPWGKYYTEAALDFGQSSSLTLDDLFNLPNKYRPRQCSWDQPYEEDHVRMMLENRAFEKRGEPQWRWFSFNPTPHSFVKGIGRQIGNIVHWRNGSTTRRAR